MYANDEAKYNICRDLIKRIENEKKYKSLTKMRKKKKIYFKYIISIIIH